MAINTTTFEASLQTKFDATTDAKEMLLLGKALEATVGSINVSNVNAEGVTQIAAVQAAMTGALPDQAGQSGKVLTSDGTNSAWAEGLPSQTSQTGKFLTTNGTAANWETLSSNSLGENMTVAAGESVTTGDVVNFYNNEIGENPVPNSQLDTTTDASQTYKNANESGTLALTWEEGEMNNHDVTVGVVQSNGSITWGSPISIYSGYSNTQHAVYSLGGDNFAMCGYMYKGSWAGTAYSFMVFFTLNPVTGGLVSKSNAITDSSNMTNDKYNRCYHRVRMLSPTKILQTTHKDNPGYGGSAHQSYVCTFTNSGSISRAHDGSNVITHGNEHRDRAWIVGANTKVLSAVDNKTWKLRDWNGTVATNQADILWDADWDSESMPYRPDDNVDKFVVAFKDASNKFVLNTYEYSSGAITKTNEYVVVADGVGVSIGRLIGTGDNLVLGYEDNSKGYIMTFTLDATTKAVSGSGLPLLSNTANKPVLIYGPNNTNKYLGLYNTAGNMAVSTIATVGAYATIPLNWIGVASTDAAAGETSYVIVDGVAGGFSGLTPGATYYYKTTTYDSTISTTQSSFKVGRAVSTTEILLDA